MTESARGRGAAIGTCFDTTMSEPHEVQLVKLGGSLITDKRRPRTARVEVIRTLAEQLRRAYEGGLPLVVGHGSGSFGHVAAAESGVQEGVQSTVQLAGVSATQEQAAALHRLVVSEIRAAGVPAFSVAPSSCLMARGGEPERLWPDPLVSALRLGLLPVVFGDVVMDDEQGAAICSTESVFVALVPALASRGIFVRRVVWLGRTDGILDRDGRTLPEIGLDDIGTTLEGLEGAAGTDVTGGIRHRLAAAATLARRGVESWIGDGRRPGALLEGLESRARHGTRVPPGPGARPC